MRRKIGDRIGALLSATKDEVKLLGYGVYVGDEVPVTAMGMLAEMCREVNHANPKLVLDSGKVVWGCECWWGDEAEVRAKVALYPRCVEVDIDEVRKLEAR